MKKDVDYKLTKCLVSQGIRVSLGHSACNYKRSYLAFANGADSQTHVYNGMVGFIIVMVGKDWFCPLTMMYMVKLFVMMILYYWCLKHLFYS